MQQAGPGWLSTCLNRLSMLQKMTFFFYSFPAGTGARHTA